jgi:hypothetical protein
MDKIWRIFRSRASTSDRQGRALYYKIKALQNNGRKLLAFTGLFFGSVAIV